MELLRVSHKLTFNFFHFNHLYIIYNLLFSGEEERRTGKVILYATQLRFRTITYPFVTSVFRSRYRFITGFVLDFLAYLPRQILVVNSAYPESKALLVGLYPRIVVVATPYHSRTVTTLISFRTTCSKNSHFYIDKGKIL